MHHGIYQSQFNRAAIMYGLYFAFFCINKMKIKGVPPQELIDMVAKHAGTQQRALK